MRVQIYKIISEFPKFTLHYFIIRKILILYSFPQTKS